MEKYIMSNIKEGSDIGKNGLFIGTRRKSKSEVEYIILILTNRNRLQQIEAMGFGDYHLTDNTLECPSLSYIYLNQNEIEYARTMLRRRGLL